MNRLCNSTLGQLPGAIARPGYDRGGVNVGIVHFGVGGFHRAHQAMYLDALMNRGEALDWGLCGVGLMPVDQKMRDALRAQDGLYTLVVKNADGRYERRVIGSIVEYRYAPDDPEGVLELMAAPSTRIVSMTVTEGGYNFVPATGEFNFANPAVAHDLQAGAVPQSLFGFVTEALRRRRARGIPPFTVMSCDNIQENGNVARRMFLAYALRKDPDLGRWMTDNVAFPNAMVDRITPVTTPPDIAANGEAIGLEDAWPVVTEPFTQWVVEDNFPLGRPPYENVGAQMVKDVEPYELMKLRLLNASHQAIAYFGRLADYAFKHDAIRHPAFEKFVMNYMVREATPTLHPVPGVDLDDYRRTLIERFANANVADTIARIAIYPSDKIPKWLLPVVHAQLASGGEISRAAATVASWARYAEGVDEHGQPIEVVDLLRDELRAIALRNREEPTAFIANRAVFGDLIDAPRFVEAYTAALESLYAIGALETVRRFG